MCMCAVLLSLFLTPTYWAGLRPPAKSEMLAGLKWKKENPAKRIGWRMEPPVCSAVKPIAMAATPDHLLVPKTSSGQRSAEARLHPQLQRLMRLLGPTQSPNGSDPFRKLDPKKGVAVFCFWGCVTHFSGGSSCLVNNGSGMLDFKELVHVRDAAKEWELGIA